MQEAKGHLGQGPWCEHTQEPEHREEGREASRQSSLSTQEHSGSTRRGCQLGVLPQATWWPKISPHEHPQVWHPRCREPCGWTAEVTNILLPPKPPAAIPDGREVDSATVLLGLPGSSRSVRPLRLGV